MVLYGRRGGDAPGWSWLSPVWACEFARAVFKASPNEGVEEDILFRSGGMRDPRPRDVEASVFVACKSAMEGGVRTTEGTGALEELGDGFEGSAAAW